MATGVQSATRAIAAVTAFAAIALGFTANKSPAADGDQSITFRRVLIPESEIKDWPRANQRFLPVDGAEFEKLVSRATRSAANDTPSTNGQIVAAHYSAELVGDELLDGRAVLDIKTIGQSPVVLPLSPCRLAIESAKWSPTAVTLTPSSTVVAPTTAPHAAADTMVLGAGADGKLAVRVTQSGRFGFAWTLQGQHEPGAAITFSLQLPQCPSSQIELTLPADLVPIVDQAIVSPLEENPATDSDEAETRVVDSSAAGKPAEKGSKSSPDSKPRSTRTEVAVKRRWLVELGGQNVALLRIAKQDVIRQRRSLTLARQSLTYDFSPRGLQLSAEMKLDVLGEPIRQLALQIDSPLTVVTARYGDSQLAWFEEKMANEEDRVPPASHDKSASNANDIGVVYPSKPRPHRIVIQLPEPLRGSGRILRIGAVAPLPSSGRLPTIRPGSHEVVWQEGTALVLVSLPLELSELHTSGCRQVKTEALPAPTEGDAMTFQFFRADADLNIGLRRQPVRFQLQSGTRIDVQGATITGRMVADLTAVRGETFSLSADIAAPWVIDSVDSSGAGVVANWSVESTRGAEQRLTIGLAKSLRGDRPLRLSIAAHWPRPPLGETLKGADFTMVKVRGAEVRRQIVALHAAAPFRLQFNGGENINRLSADRLDPADNALLGGSAGGTLFVADSRLSAVSVDVGHDAPKFSGSVRLVLTAGDDALRQSYSFTCTPESAEVDHLLLHFSRPQPGPLEWEMAADRRGAARSADPITAKKLDLASAALAQLGVADGEVWELTWRRPRTEPFTIRATRTSPLNTTVPVSLASFVQASSQQGTVEIHSTGQHVCDVQNRRLRVVQSSAEAWDRWPNALVVYRYDPQQEAIQTASDALASLVIGPGKSPPDAWVWSLSVNSHFFAQGHAEHVASWRIENLGRTRITFGLPAGNDVQDAWIDGKRAPADSFDEKAGQLVLKLPADRRFVTIVFRWANEGRPLSIVSQRIVPLPEVDLPILSRSVKLWVPPNSRLLESDDGPVGEAAISWSQRLFGPLGRPIGDAPFNPLSPAEWRSAIPDGQFDAALTRARRFDSRVAELVAAIRSTKRAGDETWSKLLTRAKSDVALERAERPFSLLIDRQALDDVGLFAAAAVSSDGWPTGHGSPMADSSFALLVSPTVTVLTTRSAAAALINRTLTADDGLCLRLQGGSLVERLTAAVEGADPRFVPIEIWELPRAGLPWIAADDKLPSLDHAGWLEYRFDSFDGAALKIWLVRRDAIVGIGCGVFLLTTLLIWRKWTLSLAARALIAAAAASLALTIPPQFSPLGAGLWLGLCCGWLLRWIVRIPTTKQATPSNGSGARLASAVGLRAGAILMIVLLLGARWLAAAEPPPPDESAGQTFYDILIPTDDQQRPVGRELLVPERLYEQLVRRAGRPTDASNTWLITSAAYRGQLAHGSGQTAVGAVDWIVHYELQTFDRKAQISLPFAKEGINLVPDGVRLDGKVVEFDWKDSVRNLAITIPEAGLHQLEMAFRPIPRAGSGATSIDFSIPPMASSVLQLDLPADLQVEVPSSVGHLSRDPGGKRLTGSLGPADGIIIRWSDAPSLDLAPAVFDADEMLWLKIRPGSVVVEARFDLRVAEGKLRDVRLVADPRLRRLPLDEGSPVAQVRSDVDDSHAMSLALAHPIANQVALKLSFLLIDSSGIGRLQVPKIDLPGVRKLTRRLAISIEPPLEADQKLLSALKATTVGDFLSAWGPADSRPQSAFLLRDAEAETAFAIHPRSPQLTSNEWLVVSSNASRLRTTWISEIEVQGGALFAMRVAAPPDFQVNESMLVEKSGLQRPLRWSRDPTGALTLFFPAGLEEQIKLLVRGETPIALDEPVSVPNFRIEDCKIDSRSVLVYRNPSVLLAIVDRGGLTEQMGNELKQQIDRTMAEGLAESKSLSSERIVGGLAGKPGTAPVSLRVARNAPRIEGSQMITMRHDADAWTAVADLDVKVTGGVLDALRFDLPTQQVETVSVEPPMRQEWAAAAGDDRQRLVLHPAEPIAGSQHLRLTIPVMTGAGKSVHVPDIRPSGLGRLRRFVRLPTNSNGQQLIWEPHGLSFERLPGSFAMTSPTTEVYRTCEVIGDRFDAVLQSVQSGPSSARVRLADIRLVMSNERIGYGTAAFDVDPAGAGSCLLDMPSEFRLVHSEMNGAPAIQHQVAPNQWNLAFADAKLPQRLEIVFTIDRTPIAARGDRPTFRSPSLVGFTVDQTLWSIDAPKTITLADDQAPTAPVTALKRDVLNLTSLTATLASTAGLAANAPEQGLSPILAFDASRSRAARSEIDRQRKRATMADDRKSAAVAIDAADAAQDELARKYGLQELFADIESHASIANGPTEIGAAISGDAANTTTVFAGAGPSGALTVRSWATTSGGFAARWPAAVIILSVLAGLFWLLSRPGFAQFAANRPQRLAIAIGIAWWFWLAPSIIGLVIIAVSLAAPAWHHQRRRRLRQQSPPSRTSDRGSYPAGGLVASNSAHGRLSN